MNPPNPNPNDGKTASWEQDLAASRDLTDAEKQHYRFLFAWFESWRLPE
jgi:hypothetical protein